MKLWTKKIDRLKEKARKAPFDARFFDRESKCEEAPEFDLRTSTWQERVKSGYEAGLKEPETTTPHVQLKGWVLSLGFQPGERGGKNPKWHMLAIALPYRRPLYDNDWRTLGGVLRHLRVPATVVEAECEHWGRDLPFAPFRFVWTPLALILGRSLPNHERFLLDYYGWPERWEEVIDRLRATAAERMTSGDPPLSMEEAAEAIRRSREADAGGYELEVDAELAARVVLGQVRIVLSGWSFVANCHQEGEKLRWGFSAKLFPFGRGSKDRDWRFLAAAAARFGAPEDSLITPVETTPPNCTLHWHWIEGERIEESNG